MESDVPDPVNIGNPHEMTIEEIAKVIIRISGSKSQIVYRPLPLPTDCVWEKLSNSLESQSESGLSSGS
jgi:hypothetical protein